MSVCNPTVAPPCLALSVHSQAFSTTFPHMLIPAAGGAVLPLRSTPGTQTQTIILMPTGNGARHCQACSPDTCKPTAGAAHQGRCRLWQVQGQPEQAWVLQPHA